MKRFKNEGMARRGALAVVTMLMGAGLTAAITSIAQDNGSGGGMPGMAGASPTPSPSVSASPTGAPGAEPTATPTASASPLSASRVVYNATLNTTNSLISNALGAATVVVDQQLGVFIQASGLDPNMMHEQAIYAGTACPPASADANGDGLIDAVEALPYTGAPIIPLGLGQQLSVQTSASATYPTAAADGTLNYIGSGQIPAAGEIPMASPTPVATSASATTPGAAGSGDLLDGHVIAIRGVAPGTVLPSTFQSGIGRTPQESVIVACGVLTRTAE